jgi:hypothetical protein
MPAKPPHFGLRFIKIGLQLTGLPAQGLPRKAHGAGDFAKGSPAPNRAHADGKDFGHIFYGEQCVKFLGVWAHRPVLFFAEKNESPV